MSPLARGRAARAVGNDTAVANGAGPPAAHGFYFNLQACAAGRRRPGPPGAHPSCNRPCAPTSYTPATTCVCPGSRTSRTRPSSSAIHLPPCPSDTPHSPHRDRRPRTQFSVSSGRSPFLRV